MWRLFFFMRLCTEQKRITSNGCLTALFFYDTDDEEVAVHIYWNYFQSDLLCIFFAKRKFSVCLDNDTIL